MWISVFSISDTWLLIYLSDLFYIENSELTSRLQATELKNSDVLSRSELNIINN